MKRLHSHCTSSCIVSRCIWSYLCHCKSLCASTPRNQLTHQSPRGMLNIGVRHQNVGSARTLAAGSQCAQAFGKQDFVYFDMKTGYDGCVTVQWWWQKVQRYTRFYDVYKSRCRGNSIHQSRLHCYKRNCPHTTKRSRKWWHWQSDFTLVFYDIKLEIISPNVWCSICKAKEIWNILGFVFCQNNCWLSFWNPPWRQPPSAVRLTSVIHARFTPQVSCMPVQTDPLA